MTIGWVFFRAADLPAAVRYLGHMAGGGDQIPGAMLLDGIVYQPYYLGTFVIAAVITWGAPADLGLDANADRAKGAGCRGAVPARRGGADDPVLQSVHLLHFLMAEPNLPSSPLPAGGPTREEIAKAEIGHTSVSPAVARALMFFFLVCIVVVPFIEIAVPRWVPAYQGASVWTRLADIPAQISAAIADEAARGNTGAWKKTLAANRATMSGMVAFENALEDESVLGRTLRPPAQQFLSGWPGAGNERVYIGRDGWLFYRPDVEYLTGRGFLDPDVMRRRVAAASEWSALPQPDPRPAIQAFHRDLQARGITLIVMPTPVKPGIHPEFLAASAAGGQIMQNGSYADFTTWLASQGILLFDPAPILDAARQSGPQYLATDTHWRPEAMELVAGRLAAFITERVTLPAVPAAGYRIEEREVTQHGDTLAMLDLPKSQASYAADRAVISRVLLPDGGAWRSDRAGDVLLLGDSFANIFSLASMGWGDGAGLVEHVSYALNRPVDRIVQNDNGAWATREMLQRGGADRLSGKRVVVWQFAARELAAGDWKELGPVVR